MNFCFFCFLSFRWKAKVMQSQVATPRSILKQSKKASFAKDDELEQVKYMSPGINSPAGGGGGIESPQFMSPASKTAITQQSFSSFSGTSPDWEKAAEEMNLSDSSDDGTSNKNLNTKKTAAGKKKAPKSKTAKDGNLSDNSTKSSGGGGGKGAPTKKTAPAKKKAPKSKTKDGSGNLSDNSNNSRARTRSTRGRK